MKRVCRLLLGRQHHRRDCAFLQQDRGHGVRISESVHVRMSTPRLPFHSARHDLGWRVNCDPATRRAIAGFWPRRFRVWLGSGSAAPSAAARQAPFRAAVKFARQ